MLCHEDWDSRDWGTVERLSGRPGDAAVQDCPALFGVEVRPRSRWFHNWPLQTEKSRGIRTLEGMSFPGRAAAAFRPPPASGSGGFF